MRCALCQASIAPSVKVMPIPAVGYGGELLLTSQAGQHTANYPTGPAAYVRSNLSYWCSYAICQREWARPPWRQPRNRPQATRHHWHYPMPKSGLGPDGQAAWGYPGVAQGGDCHHNKQRLLAIMSKPQVCQDRRVLCAGQPSARHLRSSLQPHSSSLGKK